MWPNGYVNRAAPEMLVVVAALADAAPVERMLGGLSAPSAGFVRQHSEACFAERQNSMGTKAPDKPRDTARDADKYPFSFLFPKWFFTVYRPESSLELEAP